MTETATVSTRICQEGHANALAMNKESTQIAVAGRSLLKVYSLVGDEGFQEKCNIRAGKNLNYSSNDVTWNHMEGNILATAATNGVVSVFDLSRFGRQKQLLTYNEHERTAHSVEFHMTDPNFLISCSQDGTVKRFDTRHEKAVATFYSNSESVRDVKFSPGNTFTFAAASENGQVQLWDTRRADRCTSQFTAHSEPIYTCDWHPTNPNWLATGSRDKQIKIWSIGTGEIDPVYTIQTIAVVGRVRWRPEKPYQIASCALVMDYSIYIWDIRRPFIPYASFNEHTNVTTDIAFKGDDPYSLLSTSKDSTIYRHSLRDASRSSANPQGATINYRGDFMFANKLKRIVKPGTDATDSGQEKAEQFHLAKSSLVTFPSSTGVEDSKSFREYLALKGFAMEYKLSGPLSEICDHNVEVAKRYSKPNVAMLWKWVKQFFGNSEDAHSDRPNKEAGSAHLTGTGSHAQLANRMSGSDVKHLTGHHLHAEHGLLTQQTLDDQLTNDTQLPKTFDSRGNGLNANNNLAEMDVGFILFGDQELTIESVNLLRNGFLYTGDICKELIFPALSSCNDLNAAKQSPEAVPMEPSATPNQTLLKVSAPAVPLQWEPYSVLSDSLYLQADVGDVQTPVCILIALGSNKRTELAIDEVDHENWLLSYIEQLHKHQLWNEAAEIINYSWLPSIGSINEQSTAVHTNCGVCQKPMSSRDGGYHCTKCKSSETSKCSVCHQVVRSIYSWCCVCSHGGHIQHIRDWFTFNSKCPTCGHLCEYD